MKAVLLFLCSVAFATALPGFSAAADLVPGDAVDYQPMFPDLWKKKGRSPRMIPWEGQRIVLLTTTADLDRGVLTRYVKRLDDGWRLYAEYVGKEPRPHMTREGKTVIAAVPDASYTCGVGCGNIGYSGIEVGGFYEWDYPYALKHPDAFSHYFFYEMGRNYYLFEDRHSAFTTGYSVFMRYVCMDALKCQDREAETRKKIEAVEAELAKSELTFLQAFTSVTGSGRDEYVDLVSGYPSAQKEIYASAMLKLRRDHGGDDWVRRFFRSLWRCPNIPWEPDPKDAALSQGLNWLVAASCAARKDLTPVFADRWKMPVGRKTRAALKAVDWSRPDLSPSDVLASLPPAELPAQLRETLSAFLSVERQTANRKAAEAVLGLEGTVTVIVDGAEAAAKTPAELPAGAFEVRIIDFGWGNKKLTDESLTLLQGLSGLRELRLGGADRVTDAGLAYLRGLRSLSTLSIDGTGATDAAIDQMASLPALEAVTMNSTSVTDAGLEKLSKVRSLKVVWVSHTKVTDAGLRALARLPNLETLQAADTKVTDQGLAALAKARPNLRIDR